MAQFIVLPSADVTSGNITTLANATVEPDPIVTAAGAPVVAFATAGVSGPFTPSGVIFAPGPTIISGALPTQFLIVPAANIDAGGALTSLADSFVATTQSLTGLVSARPYCAITLTEPSPPITVSTIPEAFTASMWTVTNPTTGGIVNFNFTSLPFNGGSPITNINIYQNGSATPIATGLTAPGQYVISGLTNGNSYSYTVKAMNAVGVATAASDTKTVTPTAAAATSLTPDALVTTNAELNALITSWIANPAGTTPAGKTTLQERVIQLTAPVASLAITGKNCPFPLVVRSKGPYTYQTSFPWLAISGSDVSGDITLSGCTNIRLYAFKCARIVYSGNVDCTVERLSMQAAMPDANTASSVVGPTCWGQRAVFKDCLMTGFNTQIFFFNRPSAQGTAPPGTMDGFRFNGNVLDKANNDILKYGGPGSTTTYDDWRIERNWLGSDFLPKSGEHNDSAQFQDGYRTNMRFWGNVIMQKNGKPTGTMNGAFYFSGGTADNTTHEENIYSIAGQNAAMINSGPLGGNTHNNNTMLYRNFGALGTSQFGLCPAANSGWQSKARNLVAVTSTAFFPGSEGTDGVRIDIGNIVNGAVGNYSLYSSYIAGVPTNTTYIDVLKPVSGSPAHWDFGGTQIGASTRSREIWVDKNVPGSVGWPVAGYWHTHWDPTNTIGTNHSGVYDADGNNV